MGKWWCSKTCQGDTVERIERWGKPGLESWLGLFAQGGVNSAKRQKHFMVAGSTCHKQ